MQRPARADTCMINARAEEGDIAEESATHGIKTSKATSNNLMNLLTFKLFQYYFCSVDNNDSSQFVVYSVGGVSSRCIYSMPKCAEEISHRKCIMNKAVNFMDQFKNFSMHLYIFLFSNPVRHSVLVQRSPVLNLFSFQPWNLYPLPPRPFGQSKENP